MNQTIYLLHDSEEGSMSAKYVTSMADLKALVLELYGGVSCELDLGQLTIDVDMLWMTVTVHNNFTKSSTEYDILKLDRKES